MFFAYLAAQGGHLLPLYRRFCCAKLLKITLFHKYVATDLYKNANYLIYVEKN